MSRQRPPAPWVAGLGPTTQAPSQAVVLEQLRAAILAGRASPGALIPVDAVAARFALSRIPVREALATLRAEGLVDHEPGGAYAVARLTREELAELYVVRAGLESAALGVAVPRATARDVEVAAEALRELQAETARSGPEALHRRTRAFHLALLAPCRMQRLLGMFEAAWNVTEPGRPMTHASPQAAAALADDHVRMLEAYRDRDTARLLALSATHYEHLQEVVATGPEVA